MTHNIKQISFFSILLTILFTIITNNNIKALKIVEEVKAKNIPNSNLFPIQNKDGCGFIDNQGKMVIPQKFSCLTAYFDMANKHQFYEELALVSSQEGYGYINNKGEFIIQPKFEDGQPFNQGLAAVKVDDKWGYINKSGDLVVKPVYDEVQPFNQGLAAVKVDDKWGYIGRDNLELTIASVFDRATSFSEGLAFVEYEGKEFYMNQKAEMIYTLPKGCRGSKFSDQMAKISCSVPRGSDLKYVQSLDFIDINGQGYDYNLFITDSFSEGLAPFISEGLEGFIDKKENIVIPPIFNSVNNFKQGLAIVEKQDGTWAYIDKKGKVVSEF